jgi:cobalt-zinc-cadmium efflux system membrane fusion protein
MSSSPEPTEVAPATPAPASETSLETPAVSTAAAPAPVTESAPTHAAHPVHSELPGSRKETLKTLAIMLVAVAVLGVVFAVALGWEIPGLNGAKAQGDKKPVAPLKVELVKDEKNPKEYVPHTLLVPNDVKLALGIRARVKDKEEDVGVYDATLPIASQTLEFPGSTAFDPAKIARIRVRFPNNGTEVVSIGEHPTLYRELQPGDVVDTKTKLATFYSVDVGSKKSDLVDAIWQFKLDREIYKRALESRGAVPEVFVLNAQKSVANDENAIDRAVKNLETWNVPKEDIDAIRKEAEELTKDLKDGVRPKQDPDAEKRWGQVVLKSPINGVIIERNVTKNEIIVDNTINVFQVADVSRLLVLVNVPEGQVKMLQKLKETQGLNWTIQTAGAPVNFRITAKSLAALGARPTPPPAGTMDKLKALQDREFATRQALEDELAKALTQDERENWQVAVVDAARVGLTGPVEEISYLIDQNTHTAVFKGFINNEGGVLRAGQYVTATIDLPREKNVVEIPMAAVADDGRQTVVFLQEDKTKPVYTMKRVKVTHRFDKTAYVSSALSDADVALGLSQAKDGLLPYYALQKGDRVLTSGLLELKKELDDRESALAGAQNP